MLTLSTRFETTRQRRALLWLLALAMLSALPRPGHAWELRPRLQDRSAKMDSSHRDSLRDMNSSNQLRLQQQMDAMNRRQAMLSNMQRKNNQVVQGIIGGLK